MVGRGHKGDSLISSNETMKPLGILMWGKKLKLIRVKCYAIVMGCQRMMVGLRGWGGGEDR